MGEINRKSSLAIENLLSPRSLSSEFFKLKSQPGLNNENVRFIWRFQRL